MAEVDAQAPANAAAAAPKPVKSVRFPKLSCSPAIVERRGLLFYNCDYTTALLKKAAYIPYFDKDGVVHRQGAFLDYNCAAAYAKDACDAGVITAEQFERVLKDINAHLGAQSELQLPTVPVKNLQQFDGPTSLAEFQSTYARKRAPADKYRTPEQDRKEEELRKLKKKEAASAIPPEVLQARQPLQVIRNDKAIAGARSLTELLGSACNESAENAVHAYMVASIPSQENRFAVQRFVVEKDSPLVQTIATGLPKVPSLAPVSKSSQKPILVVPRAVAKSLLAGSASASESGGSSPDSSPAASRKRKQSDAVADAEAVTPPTPRKQPKKHEAQSPDPAPKKAKQPKPAVAAVAQKEQSPVKKAKPAKKSPSPSSGDAASPKRKAKKAAAADVSVPVVDMPQA
jgi:hypothetical protein